VFVHAHLHIVIYLTKQVCICHEVHQVHIQLPAIPSARDFKHRVADAPAREILDPSTDNLWPHWGHLCLKLRPPHVSSEGGRSMRGPSAVQRLLLTPISLGVTGHRTLWSLHG
jgi:hypothetical protein